MSNDRNNTTALAAPDAGHAVTQAFGSTEIARSPETSSVALAEQAKAAVQARYIVAERRPRDLMLARSKLLSDCKRPAFAESAIYNKPVGDGVEGPSIRLAEAAARAMGNIYADIAAVYDDREKRILRVCATDLEANVTYPFDVTIVKTIERSKLPEGRKLVMVRKNSKGRDVYVIEATDDEILDKERALASKALRTCLLRLVPGDILEEAIEQCYATRKGEIKKDPTAALRKMVDAFEGLGVTAAQLAEYLAHPLDATSADEIDRMRSTYQALKDGETTWALVMEQRRGGTPSAGEKQAEDLGTRMADKAAKVNGGNGGAKPSQSTAFDGTAPAQD